MKKINFEDLNINAYDAIANKWMLITAGTKEGDYNTMTASWGHFGSLWGHNGGNRTAICFIRPTRYTKKFVDKEDYFSLSFFEEKYREDLSYLGVKSGKDEDKVSKTSLTPLFDERATYFKEAEIVLICKKLYAQELKDECFIEKNIIDDNYPLRDYHTMYVGRIEEVLIKE